jgi:phosphate transport system substrate-binding protein
VAQAQNITLSGAGATFPQPLYERWVIEYNRLNPRVRIGYQGIGSGGGIKSITDRTVDFAGSDAPLTRREREALGGESAVLEFPLIAGAVVPAYNVPGFTGTDAKPINFTGDILAEIFMGRITRWNDPRLAEINPGVALPDLAITPVWRTDGSGTTFVFTSYLASQSQDFRSRVGMGKSVSWPVGQGGKGNPIVAGTVQQLPGALGYIEQTYALANNIPFGAIRNAEGAFVRATTAAVTAAGAAAASKLTGPDLTVDLWNQPGAEAYPIAAYTYMIAYRDLANLDSIDEARALVGFFRWAATDGQKIAEEMYYAPLSSDMQTRVLEAISQLTFKGQPLSASTPSAPAPAAPTQAP